MTSGTIVHIQSDLMDEQTKQWQIMTFLLQERREKAERFKARARARRMRAAKEGKLIS